MAEQNGQQPIITMKFVPEDAWKHLNPQALEKTRLLFEYLNRNLSDKNWINVLKFYLANIDAKGLDWLFTDTAQALRPFFGPDLQSDDFQLKMLFLRLDEGFCDIKSKWLDLMKKALGLYFDDLEKQEKEKGERAAAMAKEAEEKRAKELEEQERIAREKMINKAYDTLGEPLFAGAKRYLPDEDEDKLCEVLNKAIDVFIGKGGKYDWKDLPYDYQHLINTIDYQKDLEQKKHDADIQANSYNTLLTKQIAALKKQLYPQKQNAASFFPKEISGRRLALPWASLDKAARDDILDSIHGELKTIIGQLAPGELSQFLQWGRENIVRYYRFMPVASYCFADTACLDFHLKVEAVAQLELFIKPKTQRFNGVKDFTLPFNIAGPVSLGFFYRYFPPSLFPEIKWRTVPIKLVLALMQGKITTGDCPVLYANDEYTTYRINKSEVALPQVFLDWLKRMSFQKLHEFDVINKKTLQIIESTDGLQPGSRELTRKSEGEEPATREYFQEGLSGRRFRRDELDKLWAHKPEGLTNDQAVHWALENCQHLLYNPT